VAEHVDASPGSDRRAQRAARVAELQAAAYGVALTTVISYAADTHAYDRFLAHHGLEDSGDQDVIAAFTLACFRLGYRPTTIAKSLSAIRWRYRASGDVAYMARRVLTRLKRGQDLDEPLHQAAVLSLSFLHALVHAASEKQEGRWMGEFVLARDVAVLAVGFGGALRPIEMTFVNIEHLTRHEDGYHLELPLSKTNRAHARYEGVWLARRSDELDPVRAIDRLLTVLRDLGVTNGPLFRSRREVGGSCLHGLPPAVLRARLTTLAARAGFERSVSGYSLRRSAATLLYLAGERLEDIQVRLRHAQCSTTLRYIGDLPVVARESFLDPDAPPAWAASPVALRRGDWSGAGDLESLTLAARDIVINDAVTLRSSTAKTYAFWVRRWLTLAEEEGIQTSLHTPEVAERFRRP
jgi:site-specific recombinase XerD